MLEQGLKEMEPKKNTLIKYYKSYVIALENMKRYNDAINYIDTLANLLGDDADILYKKADLISKSGADNLTIAKALETYILKAKKNDRNLYFAKLRYSKLHSDLFMEDILIPSLDEILSKKEVLLTN